MNDDEQLKALAARLKRLGVSAADIKERLARARALAKVARRKSATGRK